MKLTTADLRQRIIIEVADGGETLPDRVVIEFRGGPLNVAGIDLAGEGQFLSIGDSDLRLVVPAIEGRHG